MKKETKKQRTARILKQLNNKYPGKKAWDLDGNGQHFACAIDPADDHPEYDTCIEVIIKSRPHKHMKMTQYYTITSGTLKLHVGDKTIKLNPGDKYTVQPGTVHWAESDKECWAEIYSEPGWTKEDHIPVDTT